MVVRVALVLSVVVGACDARTDGGVAAVAEGRPGAGASVGRSRARDGVSAVEVDESGGARGGSGDGREVSAAASARTRDGGAETSAAGDVRASGDGSGVASGVASGVGSGAASGDGSGVASGVASGEVPGGASEPAGVGIRLVILADHALLGSEVKGSRGWSRSWPRAVGR